MNPKAQVVKKVQRQLRPEPYLPEFLNRGLWFNSSGEQELINSLTLFYSPRLKHCSDLAFTYLKTPWKIYAVPCIKCLIYKLKWLFLTFFNRLYDLFKTKYQLPIQVRGLFWCIQSKHKQTNSLQRLSQNLYLIPMFINKISFLGIYCGTYFLTLCMVFRTFIIA